MPSRLIREEHKRTKHDSVFSKWEILIGPSDWEEHSLGKDGIERYRIHNLPIACSCPGIYELGLDAIPTDGHRSRKHTSENVVVVYLGQADNVRTRLQNYGRAGAHLDHGSKTGSICPKSGPGLFKEIFSRGYSIMFRWSPMSNKKKAEETEARLLGVFDYAWNRRGNGACRREDILLKLDNSIKKPCSTLLTKMQQWKMPSLDHKVGIKITSVGPLEEVEQSNGWRSLLLPPPILKLLRSQPRLVRQDDDNIRDSNSTCGVALGDGSVCRERPAFGRKRCVEHKGKKISGAGSREITYRNSAACGVILEDGSFCVESPNLGRRRCELHKGRRVVEAKHLKLVQEALDIAEEYIICGVAFGDGSFCRNKPIQRRKRCELHKGRKVGTNKQRIWMMEEIQV